MNYTTYEVGLFGQPVSQQYVEYNPTSLVANYELRNFRHNGKFETEKYNMNFQEIYYNFQFIKDKLNENNEIIDTEVLTTIKNNLELINKIQYLMKKYKFIKKYQYKGE